MRQLPQADLQRRLLGNGGPIPGARGLFPQDRRPPPDGTGPELPDWLDPLAVLIAERLRDAPNLNGRQPSHLAPPFRAWPFVSTFVVTQPIAPAANALVTVDFNGNVAVPEGTNGVLQGIYTAPVIPGDGAGSTADDWRRQIIDPQTNDYFGWSLLRNGIPMPGFFRLPAGIIFGNLATQGSGAVVTTQTDTTGLQVPAPPTLRAGDTLTFELFATTWTAVFPLHVQVVGYLYPLEMDGDGIAGTVVDRG